MPRPWGIGVSGGARSPVRLGEAGVHAPLLLSGPVWCRVLGLSRRAC